MRERVAILTGGGDRPYALGLALSLVDKGIEFDFISSDFLQSDELARSDGVRVLNLRGDVRPDVPRRAKVMRLSRYYGRLLKYAATSAPLVLHILWNNKIEWFDRTLLMLYYRALGKSIVLTVHNVNIGERDGSDTWLNKLTLRAQYRLAHHLFVHTRQMKEQLETDFGVPEKRITVIPFGINETVPLTAMNAEEARSSLGLKTTDKVLLFFGNIAPYKGLEHLVEAMPEVLRLHPGAKLVVAGRPKGSEAYWERIQRRVSELGIEAHVSAYIEYIPDEGIERYFKAADALVLPYTHIFQSGVLFLGYSFGLPVLAANVGSLSQDIVEGETGSLYRAADPLDLARSIDCYFRGNLYADLPRRREGIRRFAAERYSWAKIADATSSVYRMLVKPADTVLHDRAPLL